MTRSNVLNSEERIKLYRSKLAEIEGKEGAFCIFTHPETGKFIQFATTDKKSGFIADIPAHQLMKEEIARLGELDLKVGSFGDEINVIAKIPGVGWEKALILLQHFDGLEGIARASEVDLQKVPSIGKELSSKIVNFIPKFEKQISKARGKKEYSFQKECSLEESTKLAEIFFEDICLLRGEYNVSVELERGETECFICGRIIKNDKIKFSELYLDEAHELGIPEEKIEEELIRAARFMEETAPSDVSKDEIREMVELTREGGHLFPALCSKCARRIRKRVS